MSYFEAAQNNEYAQEAIDAAAEIAYVLEVNGNSCPNDTPNTHRIAHAFTLLLQVASEKCEASAKGIEKLREEDKVEAEPAPVIAIAPKVARKRRAVRR